METIKEEKKADLEQLLNSLIERGRCPFGRKNVYIETGEGYDFEAGWIILKKEKGGTYTCESKYMPYRMLCTKSSGLWQFVCENGMIKEEHKHERILDPTFGEGWADCKRQEHDGNYGYRLIESSLKEESELEDFLLSNIKVDD